MSTTMATRLPDKFRMTTEQLRKDLAKPKGSKYKNTPVVIDGIRFASKAEGKRYQELKLLEKAGKIRDLKFHPRFGLYAFDTRICAYFADFSYWDAVNGCYVAEDVKGLQTDVFKLKARLFKANFGYDITVIGK